MRRHKQVEELNNLNATRKPRQPRQPRPLTPEALAAQEYVRKVMAERVASRTLPAFVLERAEQAKK